jgi:hypothetical protein
MWEGSEWVSPNEGAQRLLQEKIERDRLADGKLKRIQVMANIQTADLKYEIIRNKVKWVITISFITAYVFILFCICVIFAKWAF